MKNPFALIVSGLEWVGKEIAHVAEWVPKVVTLTNDVEADAQTLLPQVVNVFTAADGLVLAAVKDGGSAITAVETLIGAITTAAAAKGLNIAQDEAVATAFEAFVDEVKSSSNWADVIAQTKVLVTTWETFGAASKAAIAKLEADAAA